MDAVYFPFVADCFRQGDGRGAFDNPAVGADGRVGGIICFGRIQQDALRLYVVEELLYLPIIMYRYSGFCQMVSEFFRDFPRFDEEAGVMFSDYQVAHHYRIAMYVVATDVQCPGYFVQRGNQQGFGIRLLHFQPDRIQFLPTSLSGIFQVMNKGGTFRHVRPVRPYRAHRVGDILHGYAVLMKLLFQLQHFFHGEYLAVYAYRISRFQCVAQKSGDAGSFRQHFFVEFYAGSLQLPGGLQKVTGIGP